MKIFPIRRCHLSFIRHVVCLLMLTDCLCVKEDVCQSDVELSFKSNESEGGWCDFELHVIQRGECSQNACPCDSQKMPNTLAHAWCVVLWCLMARSVVQMADLNIWQECKISISQVASLRIFRTVLNILEYNFALLIDIVLTLYVSNRLWYLVCGVSIVITNDDNTKLNCESSVRVNDGHQSMENSLWLCVVCSWLSPSTPSAFPTFFLWTFSSATLWLHCSLPTAGSGAVPPREAIPPRKQTNKKKKAHCFGAALCCASVLQHCLVYWFNG